MINLYLVDYLDRKNSGLATYVGQLSNYLTKDKHVALHFILVNATGRQSFQKEEVNGRVHYYVPHDIALRGNSNLDNQLADYLKQETANKEQIIFHFNWVNHALFAQRLKKKINCKTLLTKHCIPWRDLITDHYSLFRNLNHLLLSRKNADYLVPPMVREHLAYHSVDHLICVTHFARQALLHMLQFPREKTSTIYNGLDFKKPRQRSKQELKARYGFDPGEQLILFAGHVHQRKGIYDLVVAFDRVLQKNNRARLVIAGEGDHRSVFRNAKKNWAKITLTGELDKETLYEFYQMADVGVIPSYVEQCSYTTIEMMCNGLPIVVSDVDGLAEIVPDDCGLKTPMVLGKKQAYIDEKELGKNILLFLECQDVANQYAFRARAYALQHFNAERMVLETVQVYEKLIADAGVPKPAIKNVPNNPLVSVVLPCYNGGDHLTDCIDSILSQTYPTFELIVIDDGSTDETAVVLERYKDKRIIVFRNEVNLGIVESLNRGVRGANGKYIARIDADDMMCDDRLYKQVQYLESNEDEEVVMVGSYHYVIDQTGQIIGLKQYPLSYGEITNVVPFQNPFSHPSVMIRTDVLKRISYSGKFPYAEDFHLWFNILKKHKAANLPEYLTCYRIHGNNVSTRNAADQRESVADLLSTELDDLGISYSASELAMHIAICYGYGSQYFNTRDKVVALDKWIEKVLINVQKQRAYSPIINEKVKDYLRTVL